MEYNKIQSEGRWGDSAALQNQNWEKTRIELMKLAHLAIWGYCLGYYSTEAKLLTKYPKPTKDGQYAFVGSPWPGTVYEGVNGAWVNTRVAPNIGDNIFKELLKRFIDGDTIYWDEQNQVIKSKGGGVPPGDDTFVITATINPGNVGQCEVTATGLAAGDVVSVVATGDKSSYAVTVRKGGTVTVKVVAKSGYQVQKLNVDTVSQGAVDSYTFDKLAADHTMYVWMEEAPSIDEPAEFMRSDAPGATFASLRKAIESVIVDYPSGGLDKDVTITCIKEGVQHRVNAIDGSSIYNAEIRKFNRDTRYCLTIDGDNKLTIDGDSLGGFYILDSDNLIFKNMTFQNIYTWEKTYSPETFAAIFATSQKNTERNIYIENVTVNGQSTLTPASGIRTFYSVIIKGYRNVSIVNSTLNRIGWCGVQVRNADVLNISKTYLSGDLRGGMSMHPYMLTLADIRELNIEDCEITAPTFNEYLIQGNNVKNIRIKRNHIHHSKGGLFTGSDAIFMREFIFANNHVHDLLEKPLYGWDTQWIACAGNVGVMEFASNTIRMTTNYFQEFFVRASDSKVDKLINVDNIFIRKGGNNSGMFIIGEVGELVADNNMYQLISTLFYEVKAGVAMISSSVGRDFAKVKKLGYDIHSGMVTTDQKILLSDDGGTRECLNQTYAEQYKCMPEYVDRFDITYKTNDAANTSIGAENYYSAAFDEYADTAVGYDGINYITNDTFTHEAAYIAPGHDLLILHHRTGIRDRFMKYLIKNSQNTHTYMALGKNVGFNLDVNVDANGEYLSDNEFTVTIE